MTTLLAHQGGWDEILLVLAPLIVFAGLLVVARRRVSQTDQTEQTDQTDEGDDSSRRAP